MSYGENESIRFDIKLDIANLNNFVEYLFSKGGLSTEENLQILFWKCNRTKGAKLIS